MKLLVELGAACANYMDKHFVNLSCERVQMDEIWSFCYVRSKNVTPAIKAKNLLLAMYGPGLPSTPTLSSFLHGSLGRVIAPPPASSLTILQSAWPTASSLRATA